MPVGHHAPSLQQQAPAQTQFDVAIRQSFLLTILLNACIPTHKSCVKPQISCVSNKDLFDAERTVQKVEYITLTYALWIPCKKDVRVFTGFLLPFRIWVQMFTTLTDLLLATHTTVYYIKKIATHVVLHNTTCTKSCCTALGN